MRIEIVNGRKIVCGHIYPLNELKVGQRWAQADGANREVVIREIEGEWIRYGEHANDRTYEKDWFNFQCRYCLVVE
jgi:hypothetical protein